MNVYKRVSKKTGIVSYQARVRRDGKKLTKTFKFKKDALAWATGIERNIYAGENVLDYRLTKEVTLMELFAGFVAHKEKRWGSKTIGHRKNLYNAVVEYFGEDTCVKHIRFADWLEFFEYKQEIWVSSTMMVHWTCIKQALETCEVLALVNNMKIPLPHTLIRELALNMRSAGMFDDIYHRTRRLMSDDREALAGYTPLPRYADAHLELLDCVDFAVETCMRVGEIVRLHRDNDIDLKKRTITIRESKTDKKQKSKGRTIPITSGKVIEIVLRQKRHSHGRLFHWNTPAAIGSVFRHACNATGVEDLHFHDLRHEGISRLFEKGLTIPEVAPISGHNDWKSLEIYTQLDIQKIGDKIYEPTVHRTNEAS